MLLAVPCARDPVEVMTQGHNLRTGFINYLQQKHAAGIVNIQETGSNQVRAVVTAVTLIPLLHCHKRITWGQWGRGSIRDRELDG